MNKIILILIFSYSSILFTFDLPIMVELRGENISSGFIDGVEEELTKMKFGLVDKKMQKLALKEQANQRKSDCYDDECLVDVGKMLAAKAIILIDIKKHGSYSTKFITRYIDLETGVTKKKTTKYFHESLNDDKKVYKWGKDLVLYLFKKEFYMKTKPESKEDSNWTFSIAGNLGIAPKSIKLNEDSYGGVGIAFSVNLDLSYNILKFKDEMTINLYSEASYWSFTGSYNLNNGENNDLLLNNSLFNLNLGFEFIFGRKVLELPLFLRIGFANGYMTYNSTSENSINKYSFKTFGLAFEIGIDQKFYANIFDLYIGTVINLYMYEVGNSSVKVSGGDYPIFMGIRHNF